ncbi:MAG: hypothetical protein Q3996_01695 [Candidatus Saccharibacteria bacterium]|nr:hypothetical protein [Candidatus Saccharibacteria bacterium]
MDMDKKEFSFFNNLKTSGDDYFLVIDTADKERVCIQASVVLRSNSKLVVEIVKYMTTDCDGNGVNHDVCFYKEQFAKNIKKHFNNIPSKVVFSDSLEKKNQKKKIQGSVPNGVSIIRCPHGYFMKIGNEEPFKLYDSASIIGCDCAKETIKSYYRHGIPFHFVGVDRDIDTEWLPLSNV